MSSGLYRKFVPVNRSNASRRFTKPRLAARLSTPRVPVASKPFVTATAVPYARR